ncbi:thiamine diphosphokinase [Agrilactobacillus yilanensis]|uniref:Thiamine diphosphokinase n=1 Tax=Agrilactobacillus yilanensis TaxID=2485997 RepID=A0ABW4J9U5_9LACO|nr:thiamine diphosphokinase [Agrilactobacillus yilanensis]
MKRINLLLGGPMTQWPTVLQQQPQSIPGDWLGVDRGALRLLNLGRLPVLAVGDFDSLTPEELKLVQTQVADIHYAQPEKDDTDSELGLRLAFEKLQADEVVIYGATGARIDHFLVNLLMLLEPRFRAYAPKVKLVDKQNTIRFFLAGEHVIHREKDKKYLAFINLTPIDAFDIFDAKYRLTHKKLTYDRAYASNEFVGNTVHFALSNGVMCVIQSTD